MKVVRMQLTDVTLVPPNIRFFEGKIQITFDGGITWVDSPENDPRYGAQFVAPALTGEDARCDAAYRMTQIIRAQVDAALDAATAVGLATAILGIVTILIPINPLVALVTALAALMLAIGAIVLDAAFTEERYHDIQCIFYNNISDNGQVNADQLESILTDFETQFAGSIAADVCVSVVFVMGQNGLSNAGSLTGGDGDCSECPIFWCYDFDMLTSDNDFEIRSSPPDWGGVWTSGAGWQNTNTTSLNIGRQLPNDVRVNRIGFSSTAYGAVAVACYENADYTGTQYFRFDANDSGDIDVFCPAGAWLVCINGSATDYPFQQYRDITAVHVQGTDEEPFGESTC